jgi:hypothetical protein
VRLAHDGRLSCAVSLAPKRSPRGAGSWAAAALGAAVAGGAAGAWALRAADHLAERHVLANACATGPAGWALARAAPALAGAVAALGAAAVAWALGALARRLRRGRPRAFAGALAGVAIAIACSLAVVEVSLRRLRDRASGGASATAVGGTREMPMARPDPRLGWAYVPRRTTWAEVGGRRVAYAIDAEGDRAASPDGASDPDRPTVLFAGESIAFGYGLAHAETFPALVGQELGVQAVNLAVVGYGNDQAHLRLLDALPRYRRPLAVVTLFVPDQLRRNVDRWRPRLALADGGALALVPAAGGPALPKLLQALPFHDGEALRVTAAVLRATAQAARARGAVPLFVVTNYGAPCLREPGRESWVVEELFVRQALPFVRVDLAPGDRLPGLFERHPDARGARAIAAAVEGALVERLASRRGADRPER